jgi:hypothetical protein
VQNSGKPEPSLDQSIPYLLYATLSTIYQYQNKFSMMIIWMMLGKSREIMRRGRCRADILCFSINGGIAAFLSTMLPHTFAFLLLLLAKCLSLVSG